VSGGHRQDQSPHTLYDWGASVPLVTEKAGLKWVRQPTSAVAGLSGRCIVVDFHYMVLVVDGDDKVQVVKAMGVDSIVALDHGRACRQERFCRPEATGRGWRGHQETWSC
jgi:hypothetical protein